MFFVFGICLTIITSYYIHARLTYVKFKPVRFDGNNYSHYKMKIEGYQKVNFIICLTLNNVPLKLNEYREITIPKIYYSNTDLLNRVTLEALDEEWIKRHILLSSDSTHYIY